MDAPAQGGPVPSERGAGVDAGRPAEAGKPAEVGKPEEVGKGKPDEVGKPLDPGRPEDKGKPDEKGKPEDAHATKDKGRPEDKVKPDDPGGPKEKGGPEEPRRRTLDAPAGPPRPVAPPVAVAPPREAAHEAPTPPPRPAIRVLEGEETVEVASGDVRIEVEHLASGRAFLALIAPDGSERLIDATIAPWNTTDEANGYYTIEARERDDNGNVVAVASTTVLVHNARDAPVVVVASVATSAAVSAGAGFAGGRLFELGAALKGALTEMGGELAEDKAREKRWTSRAWGRALRTRSIVLIALAGLFVAFFKAVAERGRIDDPARVLPLATLAIFACAVGAYAAEWALARAMGAQARFRGWLPGAISLVLSALLLRTAFGYPGFVEESDAASPQLRRKGLRAAGALAGAVALAFPVLVLGIMVDWTFAEFGVGVAFMIASSAAMPFAPMPGYDLWRWKPIVWAPVFGAIVLLYLLWQLAVLAPGVIALAGLAGASAFLLVLVALRSETSNPAAALTA